MPLLRFAVRALGTMSGSRRLLPLLNRVLVEKLVAPTKTSSGIMLPETVGTKVRAVTVGNLYPVKRALSLICVLKRRCYFTIASAGGIRYPDPPISPKPNAAAGWNSLLRLASPRHIRSSVSTTETNCCKHYTPVDVCILSVQCVRLFVPRALANPLPEPLSWSFSFHDMASLTRIATKLNCAADPGRYRRGCWSWCSNQRWHGHPHELKGGRQGHSPTLRGYGTQDGRQGVPHV